MNTDKLLIYGALGVGGYYLYTNYSQGGSNEQKHLGGNSNILYPKKLQNFNDKDLQILKELSNKTDKGASIERADNSGTITGVATFHSDDSILDDSSFSNLNNTRTIILYKKDNKVVGGSDFINERSLTPEAAQTINNISKTPLIAAVGSGTSHYSSKKESSHHTHIITYQSFDDASKSKDTNTIRAYKTTDNTTAYIDTKRKQSITKKEAKFRSDMNSIFGGIF